ncbi:MULTISPECIES: hypothetical protein [Sphingomonadales]|jgi:hypothetical protein|uniref:Lipoprotein n=1 Tax=Sphingobium agri TaxID=2933566 RepID=A0ABT0E1Y9_9SPHN|nr:MULTISPECIES: hypothetical protein [Sphingomonadaceae]MCK0533383.1 hypothetical protein [Sphingobium agri]
MTAISLRAFALTLPAAALFLSSCATVSPESKVRAGLIEAGLSPRMASCMAERMVDRLSLVQLRRVQSLASIRNSHIGDLTVDRFLYKLRALEDPEIFAVTSKAAVACALLD